MEVDAEQLVPLQLQVQSQQEPAGQQQQQQQQQLFQQGINSQQQQQQQMQGGGCQPATVAQVNGASCRPAVVQQVVDSTTGSSSVAAVLLSSPGTQQCQQENSSSKEGQLDGQRQQQQQRQQEAGEVQQGNKQKQETPQKPRPTHFVSLRVSQSPQVIEWFERVQQQLVSVNPKLQPCLLEPVTAHMTILVLHIQTEEHEAMAASVMSSLPEVLQQQGLGQLQVTLQGLSTFRNQVLYLDVAPGPALNQLQLLGDAVMSHFHDQGPDIFLDEGGRGFTPHVTVAKTSRLKGFHHRHKKGRSNTKIPQEAWNDLADVSAGDVLLTELEICSMQGRKAGEFYKVTHSIQLPEVPLQPPPQPPAAAAPAAAPAAAAAAAAAEPPVRQRKRAAGSPLAGAKQRFRRLLDALVCRRREDLGHVDTDSR